MVIFFGNLEHFWQPWQQIVREGKIGIRFHRLVAPLLGNMCRNSGCLSHVSARAILDNCIDQRHAFAHPQRSPMRYGKNAQSL